MLLSGARNLIFKMGWDTRCRNDEVARALETVASRAGLLLDAGSGEYGLSTFLASMKVIGTDIHAPVHHSRAGTFVRGSITALPFGNQSFPAVASVDVLEHLGPAARDMAIAELVRVARAAAVIAFPCGPNAEQTDRKFHARLVRSTQAAPEWLVEHLQNQYPSVEGVLVKLASESGVQRRSVDARVFYCEHIGVTRLLRWAAWRSRLSYIGINLVAGLFMRLIPRPRKDNSYRAVIIATFNDQ